MNTAIYRYAAVDRLLDEQNALIDNAERTALMIQGAADYC